MLIIDQLSRGRWMWLVIGGAVAAASVFSGCSGDFTSCQVKKNCGPYDGGAGGAAGSAGHGGFGGSGGSGQSGSGGGTGGLIGMAGEAGEAGSGIEPCDTTQSPTTESCLVADIYGVFVAPTGDDSNAGSMLKPVKTISKAIELAQADGKFVVACDAAYDEQLKLTAGATLYGGFACPGTATPWSYEPGKKAKVAPSTRGVALSIASVSAVLIEDFEFDAKDGTDPGESSIAAFVNTSTSVALTRVKLVAGKGVDGASGSLVKVTPPDPATLDGHSAVGGTGGTPNPMTCAAGGSTKGGAGGNGGGAATGGGGGTPMLGGGAAGVFGAVCAGPGSGGDGTSATSQSPAAGATQLGSVTPAGWSGANGNDGPGGTPGQGGGGGAGKDASGGGGGGGAGGCGGAGGTGGKAGGSSIALVVLNSTLAMTADELIAANAGKGGSGVAGQDGLPAGNGGVQAPGGCAGGAGGKGGAGAAGGGAAGGISVGIAWAGTSAMDPTPMPLMSTKITTGTAGAKGIGGAATNDGVAGVKQDVLQVL